MKDFMLIILVLIALLLFTGSIYLRSRTGSKYEIKNIDLIIALLPFLVWLFLSNKLEEINFLGVGFKTAKEFVGASNEDIQNQVAKSESFPIQQLVEEVEMAAKGATGQIPFFVEQKVQALEFRLGYGNYYGEAIKQYLNTLLQYPYLKFVVIENQKGEFVAYFDAQVINTFLANSVD